MTCNVCNMLINEKERAIPKNNEWYPKDEIWFIEYENDEYNIVFTYDCGCAKDVIKNIKYCPLCGRELK